MDLPTSVDGALDSQLSQLQALITDLVNRMTAARVAGNDAEVQRLRQDYLSLTAQAAALRSRANASGAPPEILVKLDAVSDTLLQAGRDVYGGFSALLKWTPYLVLGMLVVLGLYLYRKAR